MFHKQVKIALFQIIAQEKSHLQDFTIGFHYLVLNRKGFSKQANPVFLSHLFSELHALLSPFIVGGKKMEAAV